MRQGNQGVCDDVKHRIAKGKTETTETNKCKHKDLKPIQIFNLVTVNTRAKAGERAF